MMEEIAMSIAQMYMTPWFWILIIWSLFWKGWALWTAGNRKDKIWFIILFLFNTAGLLEIVYIFFIAKCCSKSKKTKRTIRRKPAKRKK
jgi:methionyl-tRNA synthetase